MKFKLGLVTAGCLAAMGLAGQAQAIQLVGEQLEFVGSVYPQYQMTNFGDGSGSTTSNMTAGSTTAALPAAPAVAGSANKAQINWVNSYLGFKGKKTFGDVTAGYEFQGVLMKNGTTSTEAAEIGEARDAYVSVAHNMLGTLQLGQMDTILKEFGDRVRMLGISSSNFVSTSGIVLGPTWKTQKDSTTTPLNTNTSGVVTFNTRVNGQLRWVSPSWGGVQLGASYRPDPNKTSASDASLTSYGVRWSNASYYVGLATEQHNDYRGFSGNVGATAGTIYNTATVRSKDTASRLSFGYIAEKFKLGADLSSLEYTEAGAVGKFGSYNTTAWQISGEYSIAPKTTVAANYASGDAGTCSLVGGATCSTNGLGGTLLSLGARYDYDQNIGLYAIYGLNTVGSSATLASGAVGGNVTNMAVGIHVRF